MKEIVNFFPIFANIPTKHKPSEMEVAPPHKLLSFLTRPSALGMSDPIWGPLIHIFVEEKKN